MTTFQVLQLEENQVQLIITTDENKSVLKKRSIQAYLAKHNYSVKKIIMKPVERLQKV
jgi:hypothetical protein